MNGKRYLPPYATCLRIEANDNAVKSITRHQFPLIASIIGRSLGSRLRVGLSVAVLAEEETRLKIPRDISIIGFDDIRFSGYCDPPLTAIHQPQAAIGEMAMQLMIELLENPPDRTGDSARSIVLPHSLIVRASTGRAAST